MNRAPRQTPISMIGMKKTVRRSAVSVSMALLRSRFLTLILTTTGLTNQARAEVPGLFPNDEPSQSCAAAETADRIEAEMAAVRESKPLQDALSSESALWVFLISPSTSYLDRMAAALRGGSLFSANDLPKLWKAYAELEMISVGVNPSPCEFVWPNAWHARSPQAWAERKRRPIPGVVADKMETRTVLGIRVDLPLNAMDYPLNIQGQGRNETPCCGRSSAR
jgi:hypothetical protein